MLTLDKLTVEHRVGPVSGRLAAGRLTLLVGPNGSGKSSLLLAAAGLVTAEGHVRLNGELLDTLDLAELARRRAMLVQHSVLPAGLKGYELLALGVQGEVSEAACEEMARLSAYLKLDTLYGRSLLALSGGEQQRLLIAKTLLQVSPALNPEAQLLLLDEPLAGLDWQHQLATLRLLRHYAEQGLTVVASIHDINLAAQFGDDIWCLHKGQLVASGGPEVLTPTLVAEVFEVKVRLLEQDGQRLLLPEMTGIGDSGIGTG
ncbi:ATP-binding cassette domain-containing protein [Oceanimonas sp. CAM02]|uniref:vitamin B12 ABC transporter ATP-binding protein BtuD n=1 Tax=Oceanimonas sp. CAM02 TaxID=3080336 RepID=UPI0029358F3E|nr:ATP-binding cassette domain-containing protein [Oceanimonas sp. CAM02]MDV2857483.1 ATP-binding cassette domain-containing protein [Oceanimonas sp. CAM02]